MSDPQVSVSIQPLVTQVGVSLTQSGTSVSVAIVGQAVQVSPFPPSSPSLNVQLPSAPSLNVSLTEVEPSLVVAEVIGLPNQQHAFTAIAPLHLSSTFELSVDQVQLGYSHTQSILSDVWLINHNLGRYPVVTLYNSGGAIVEGSVLNLSINTVQVSFSQPITGFARLF